MDRDPLEAQRRRRSQVAVTVLVFCLSHAHLASSASSSASTQEAPPAKPQSNVDAELRLPFPTQQASSSSSSTPESILNMPTASTTIALLTTVTEARTEEAATTTTTTEPVVVTAAASLANKTRAASSVHAETSELLQLQHRPPQQQQQRRHYNVDSEPAIRQPLRQPMPYCMLGEDTFHIGERWNPNLPPFGIQVCVLCECTVRSRKSCYETRTTCRRITNECPIIDSCPDGKKPVTQPGQCCKSCQSQPAALLAYEAASSQHESQQVASQQTSSFKIIYMNERIKDYMSMVKELPACPGDQLISGSGTSASGVPAVSATTQTPGAASKNAKGTRNDLNGIDTRLAFKSLHDSAPNFIGFVSSSRNTAQESVGGGKFAAEQALSSSTKRRMGASNSQMTTTTTDTAAADHQHPNDVQLATQSPLGSTIGNKQQVNQYGVAASAMQPASGPTPNSCQLGNETFQVGDVWRPILPPHGVQVCVQCNCIFRVRRGCYETKITCRRTHRDCPVIEVCPDGQAPVVVEGQCCKSCQPSASAAVAAVVAATSNVMNEQQQQQQHMFNSLPIPETIQRNEKVYREFQHISKNLNGCIKNRESVDIYQTNRYAKRSHNNNYNHHQ